MLVDSHCHLDRIDLSEHNDSLEQALSFAEKNGVNRFLCIATGKDNFEFVHDIAIKHAAVSCTVGVHPLSKSISTEGLLEFLVEKGASEHVVGIGETGLDGFYAKETLAQQMDSFVVHHEASIETGLPLIIHTRDARQQTLDLICSKPRENAGVLHCFTEDWDMAKQAIDVGYFVSISGIVTFRQADNVREMAKKIPLDRLLVETDSPYLAPVPFRGKPCQPAYTKQTAEFLAELRGESFEQLAKQTTENFYTLFSKAQR
ncbi:MAG: TatD family hydrolase [Gammaproteobacteria bacterium]|nr:TatD family hydrolase [Gammaproteobacteria bacterium]